ncbi:Menaquinone-specific isochorismate synthase [Halanaeroarchaeum sp. HSR-CO]|uniref:isochorismate synthase n=1 Tax=Halanaeroarchaeum sp. HSR-CO TaxID=2866382 RepID=UPI00217D2DE0|nr:isochorismate synthase [Halanaeroarchaeum sp. HSR-CO]UWG47927.1 Menaquinone-specific isochorismate synthase [Halanaeroarchaeum sp. HSR-CO]
MASRDGQETTQTAARLVSRSVSIPPTPLRDVLRMDRPIHAAWTAPGERTLVASGAATTVATDGSDRFATIRDRGANAFDTLDTTDVAREARPRFIGGFAFHDRHDRVTPWQEFPGAWFVLPKVQVVLGDDGGWITVTADASDRTTTELDTLADSIRDGVLTAGPVGTAPGVESTTRATTYDQWTDQLDGALARIENGEIEKVTLAQTLRAELGAPFALAGTLERLGETYPDCFRFSFRPDADEYPTTPPGEEPAAAPTFFGASPERLVTKQGESLLTGALASTVGRGETPAEDDRLTATLESDEKFEREHEVVVQSIHDQLAPVARNVRPGERSVRKLDSVQHLYTPVEATPIAEHVLDLVEALHPTPAVGGLPPSVALETIRRTEAFDRGWYAAPVGWFDESGDGTFAVGIRSAVAAATTATLFAGNGIVADSNPHAEWDEVQLKYEPILDALR